MTSRFLWSGTYSFRILSGVLRRDADVSRTSSERRVLYWGFLLGFDTRGDLRPMWLEGRLRFMVKCAIVAGKKTAWEGGFLPSIWFAHLEPTSFPALLSL